MGLREDIVAAMNNAEANATSTGSTHWNTIPSSDRTFFGYNPNQESFFVAIGPSHGDWFDWRPLTPVVTNMRGSISLETADFEVFRVIRFNKSTRRKYLDFLADLVRILQDEDSMADETLDSLVNEYETSFSFIDAPLTPEEARGLQGELIVLDNLINQQGPSITTSWMGPSGTLHDFVNEEQWHIEVKESTLPNPIAIVHPIEQLEPIGLPFNLVMVRLMRNDDGQSLPEMIDQIRNKLGDDNANRTHFRDMIQQSGYLDNHSDRYSDKYLYEVSKVTITEDSPVLHPGKIDNSAQYHDIRWRLRLSDYTTTPVDDVFWGNPIV